MSIYKLRNVQPGYAEVLVSLSGKFGIDDKLDGMGYVATEEFVERSDFENDIVIYRTRWVAYVYTGNGLNGYTHTGRFLGYDQRKKAIKALVSDIMEDYSSASEPALDVGKIARGLK